MSGSIINDVIEAGAGDDWTSGGSGNDLLSGQDGRDAIDGGSGFDTLFGGAGDDTLSGGAGNDVIHDGPGNDLINEGSGNDTIFLGEGEDRVQAGSGIWRLAIHGFNSTEDRLIAAPSTMLTSGLMDLDSDGAVDDLRMVYSSGATIDLFSIQLSTIYLTSNATYREGNPFNDTIVGFGNADTIDASGGDDVIYSGDGNDQSFGGLGNDSLYGQAGNDFLNGNQGDDVILGGDGADVILNDLGNDIIFGDSGNDRIDAPFWSGGQNTNNVDYIMAGGGDDTVNASASWDYIDAGDGNDLVIASSIVSTRGVDALHGGGGTDTLSFENVSVSSVTVNLAWGQIQLADGATGTFSGFERIQLGASRDIVVGWTGNPTIDLGSGDDWFADYSPTGAASNDTVFGGFGNDALYGLAGDDSLNGGENNDFVIGGDGADTLIGGAGGDWMHGGAGADMFRYLAVSDAPLTGALDVAAGFEIGVDKIDLAAIDANSATFGDDAFTIGALQAGVAGRLAITLAADLGGGERLWQVRGDVNGDGVADFQIWVVGAGGALGAGDFVL
jgi:Ca2+-binding RTX toxin-like protein